MPGSSSSALGRVALRRGHPPATDTCNAFWGHGSSSPLPCRRRVQRAGASTEGVAMEIAVQTLMALDLAVAEFRHRIGEQVFIKGDKLSPLCHRPVDLHHLMERFAQLMAQPLGVILIETDPDTARATLDSFLENARLLLGMEMAAAQKPGA